MSESPANQGCFASQGRINSNYVTLPSAVRSDSYGDGVGHLSHRRRGAGTDGGPSPARWRGPSSHTLGSHQTALVYFAKSLEKMASRHRVETGW